MSKDVTEEFLIKSHMCSVAGCTTLSRNVEFCPKHYSRLRRVGTIVLPPRVGLKGEANPNYKPIDIKDWINRKGVL